MEINAWRAGFWPAGHMWDTPVFVCLSAGYLKKLWMKFGESHHQRILTKIFLKLYYLSSNKLLSSGADPNHSPGPGILMEFLPLRDSFVRLATLAEVCGLQMLIVVVFICTFVSTTAPTKVLVIYYLSIGNLVIFRLDALAKALSVIATVTWLAGCLSQPVLYQND